MAYLGTHVCARKTKHVYFDTDAVEVLLVTGCSITQSSARSDIITYKPPFFYTGQFFFMSKAH